MRHERSFSVATPRLWPRKRKSTFTVFVSGDFSLLMLPGSLSPLPDHVLSLQPFLILAIVTICYYYGCWHFTCPPIPLGWQGFVLIMYNKITYCRLCAHIYAHIHSMKHTGSKQCFLVAGTDLHVQIEFVITKQCTSHRQGRSQVPSSAPGWRGKLRVAIVGLTTQRHNMAPKRLATPIFSNFV